MMLIRFRFWTWLQRIRLSISLTKPLESKKLIMKIQKSDELSKSLNFSLDALD